MMELRRRIVQQGVPQEIGAVRVPHIRESRRRIESAHQYVMIHEPTRLPMADPRREEREYREIAIGPREGAKHALLALGLLFDGARDLVSPEPFVADAMDHENDVGDLVVWGGGQRIGHVSASDRDFFEIVVAVAGGFRQQQEPRLIRQSEFSTNVREGFAVRRQTADRVLQHLALVSFRFSHFYGAVMRGVWRLEQNKGGIVAPMDDDINRVVRRNQIIDSAQDLNHENRWRSLASGESSPRRRNS